jgi:hypothetical protein
VKFIRIADGVDLSQPVEVAKGRRVFELYATTFPLTGRCTG